MFEHLDDPNPHSLGTDHQLAAARNRGRVLARHSRRNRLAAGSAAVAATAGVAAVAVVGLPSRSVAGTAADSSASPYPIPTPTASSSPTPAPVPASATASPVPVPTSSAQPYPSPSVSVTVPANAPATASPTPAPVPPTPSLSAVPTVNPSALAASPTDSPVPTTTATPVPTATTMTSDCAAVTSALKTTPMPTGYTPLVPPSGVLSWSHTGAPINSVVVTVHCAPFDPSQAPAGAAVKEITVLDAHSWLLGDPSTGVLQLAWNATPQTSVTVTAGITLPEKTGQVEDQLLTLGNMLID